MSTSPRTPNPPEPTRWVQPFTFGGVAACASVSFARLLCMMLALAALCSGAAVWSLIIAWQPVFERALEQLPLQGAVMGGHLAWPADSPVILAENRFLSLAVDMEGRGDVGQSSDVQVEFGAGEARLRSILGYLAVSYPDRVTLAFNRTDLEPWWGAWKPAILAVLLLAMLAILAVLWSVLGLVHWVPVRIIAFYADRELSALGAWKFGVAVFLPGALVLCAALPLYAYGQISLLHVLAMFALHLVVGWIYLVLAPFWLPRMGRPTSRRTGNPFVRRSK